MGRRKALDRPVPLYLKLPETVRSQLDLHLYSEVEQRVPHGSYQAFFISRIQEFFSWRRLDLAPHGFPAGYFVAGPQAMIDELERRLKL